ncbi:MAG: helix-turn-helix transcriptional regulator [Oscillospiraceae bacterium]|nr:helix-turn-helix transcriptional regulator [Oscillospiraceae bacterium]
MNFYEKIINLIYERGITQRQFMEELNLCKSSVQNWRRQGSKPRPETMKRIADYFAVDKRSLEDDSMELTYLRPKPEEKVISAKDLYCWNRGNDSVDVNLLAAFNNIIDGLTYLQSNGGWEKIIADIQSSTTAIAEIFDDVYSSSDLMEMVERFETIRTVLFGDKINYKNLLYVLNSNVEEKMRRNKE